MAAKRRLPILGVLLVALIGLLPMVSADAAFVTSRALPSMGVTTQTVRPPTNVSAVLSSCSNNRWMNITVSWTGSWQTPGVTGYLVNEHDNTGATTAVAQTSAAATSANVVIDKLATGATSVTFTVITQTSYGWTAESASSGSLTC